MQKQYYSSIKGGLMTGFIFGLFVLPGYALSSFETVTAYPFYVLQLMLFSVLSHLLWIRHVAMYYSLFSAFGWLHQAVNFNFIIL